MVLTPLTLPPRHRQTRVSSQMLCGTGDTAGVFAMRKSLQTACRERSGGNCPRGSVSSAKEP